MASGCLSERASQTNKLIDRRSVCEKHDDCTFLKLGPQPTFQRRACKTGRVQRRKTSRTQAPTLGRSRGKREIPRSAIYSLPMHRHYTAVTGDRAQ